MKFGDICAFIDFMNGFVYRSELDNLRADFRKMTSVRSSAVCVGDAVDVIHFFNDGLTGAAEMTFATEIRQTRNVIFYIVIYFLLIENFSDFHLQTFWCAGWCKTKIKFRGECTRNDIGSTHTGLNIVKLKRTRQKEFIPFVPFGFC